MVRYWRAHAKHLSLSIKDREEKLAFLHGKGASDIRQIAMDYEYLEGLIIGVHPDSFTGDFELLDPASRLRDSNATIFNVCGWC